MLIILFISLIGWAKQDEEEHKQDPKELSTDDLVIALEKAEENYQSAREETLRYVVRWTDTLTQVEYLQSENESLINEMERDGRSRILTRLERILLQRYIEPVDKWIDNPALTKHDVTGSKEDEPWFVLIIEPQNALNESKQWVKFCIPFDKFASAVYRRGYPIYVLRLLKVYYKDHLRDGILDSLERQLVENMDDPEMIKLMQDGTPHLYVLPTKDSDPDKVQKEDRIY
jgi:hypothetical protein